MATARQDFERFVRWLYQPGKQVPVDVRRLAILLLANFDVLARTSRQRSQRASYLARLMRGQLAQTLDAEPAASAEAMGGAWPWSRLRHLTLGPFRGFRTPEPFDLKKQIILFYGPNGSGKTSLCEGLEYALLGDVEEAGSKRIDARTYLKNVHAGRFDAPILKATDFYNREIAVTANPDTYRFCFIEKNRIDAFSRIAAKPNALRAELIATLFGMDQFNEFVSHFNESIDSQLVLRGDRQAVLIARRSALVADQNVIEGELVAHQHLLDEETALAHTFAVGTTYAGLKQLIGSAEAPGRLQELQTILEAAPPTIVGITRKGLLDAFDKAYRCCEELNEIANALRARSDQVSFKSLYTSVLALREAVGDRCPACETPLNGPTCVAVNPYDKAATGLEQLKELGVLQEKQKAAQAGISEAKRNLRQMLRSLTAYISDHQEQETQVGKFLAALPEEPDDNWLADVYSEHAAPQPQVSMLERLLKIGDRIAIQDAASEQVHQKRQQHIDERKRLDEFRLKVQLQELKRTQLRDSIAAAKGRIEAFDVDNAELIAQTHQERRDIECDVPLKMTYDRFLDEIRTYRAQLPGQLMAGLNEAAMTLYNAFNRNDWDADKLYALHLPLTGDSKIEITFRGKPNERVDALHVLSEGHIRCLGLAILLAKAKSIQCPVIIFDDAINAIDHDHRGGIRETIFESDHFAQTQLILTCHSNEFIKDIEQHLPKGRRNECQIYLFRHHNGDHQPRVKDNVPTQNYIARAREARAALNDREALAASRQALEMLSEKVWRWLGSHGLGDLNLTLPGINAEPTLRNLCIALENKLKKASTFNHPDKELLLVAYRRILGIPETNLVWTYLNKGTHEEADRDDFDGELVASIVQTLEELDKLNLRRGR